MAHRLRIGGYDALYLGEIGLLGAPDNKVLATAANEGRVLISADTDFGELLTSGRRVGPSVILLRASWSDCFGLLLTALDENGDDLAAGAIMVIRRPSTIRVRRLPLG